MRLIDISLPIDDRLPVWPGDPQIEIAQFLDINCGDVVNASRVGFSAHVGTHVDAPRHHFADGEGVDRLRLHDLVGPAIVAHIPDVRAVGAFDLQKAVGHDVRRLLLKTDNSTFCGSDSRRFRTDFVALTSDGADWIVDRGIRLIGIDYMSIEAYGAPAPVVHRTLLSAGIVVVEGLNLVHVQPGSYELVCLPLRLTGLDAAPARAVLIDQCSSA